MFLFLIIFCFLSTCCDLDRGWVGIKPLKTDKRTVDKLLGAAIIDDVGDYHYNAQNASIRIRYSGAPCQNLQFGRGMFNVPRDTVLQYTVRFKNRTPISSLEFDRKKYVRDTGGDVTFVVGYNNPSRGVEVEAEIEQGQEYVHAIHFNRTPEDAQKFKCS